MTLPGDDLPTTDDRGEAHQFAHLPWHGSHVLILRDEAIEEVGPLVRPHGQLLPLRSSGARLAVFRAYLLAGALDAKAFEIIRFSSR